MAETMSPVFETGKVYCVKVSFETNRFTFGGQDHEPGPTQRHFHEGELVKIVEMNFPEFVIPGFAIHAITDGAHAPDYFISLEDAESYLNNA